MGIGFGCGRIRLQLCIGSVNHVRTKPIRRSIRLREYNYAQAGAYFVTIVTQDRVCLFGEVVDGEMMLNEFGRIVHAVWDDLPNHYPAVECGVFVVMPNHVHGIIVLDGGGVGESDVGAGFKPARSGPTPSTTPRAGLKPAPTRTGLSEIVRAFKTFSARRIKEIRGAYGLSVWQRNYYEHVVRNEEDLNRIHEYIVNNPLQWELDRENPNCIQAESIRKRESWEV
jgi:REP element-mobilizing transposase RayT